MKKSVTGATVFHDEMARHCNLSVVLIGQM